MTESGLLLVPGALPIKFTINQHYNYSQNTCKFKISWNPIKQDLQWSGFVDLVWWGKSLEEHATFKTEKNEQTNNSPDVVGTPASTW